LDILIGRLVHEREQIIDAVKGGYEDISEAWQDRSVYEGEGENGGELARVDQDALAGRRWVRVRKR
jgi:hypothetical protein